MNRGYRNLALASLLLMAAVFAACGGSEPANTDGGATLAAPDTTSATSVSEGGATAVVTTTPPEASATSAGSAPAVEDPIAGSVYAALLAAIPDSPEAREFVHINNYELVRRLFDIPLPGPRNDDAALERFYDWVPPLAYDPDRPTPVGEFGGLSFFGPRNQAANIGGNMRHLAFDIRDMDQSIVTGQGVTDTAMDVVLGRFDAEATERALTACSCTSPSREEHSGVAYYSWGEDYARGPALGIVPAPFDELGRGARLAVLDGFVFRTRGTSEMKALIDAVRGGSPTLADVEEFRLLAGGMSQLGAYVMLLSDGSGDYDMSLEGSARPFFYGTEPTQAQLEEMKQRLAAAGGPLLRPFDAYATGAGMDDDGPYMALTLVHADDASAEQNVGLLQRRIEEGGSLLSSVPWSENIDTSSLEIRTEGRVLTAKLRGDISRLWLDWLNQRDGLIMHE